MSFDEWFEGSCVVDSHGDALLVFHGTSEVRHVPAQMQPGNDWAHAKLQQLARHYDIADWTSVAPVFERWEKMGMLGREYARGLDAQKVAQARRWHEQSRPVLLSEPQVKLGFDCFQMPAGQKELGAHFGTRAQALHRGHPFGFYLSLKNPIRLPDLGSWDFQNVLRQLKKQGHEVNEKTYESIFNAQDNNAALRDWLMLSGIDGVIYENQCEGSGLSFIAFSPDQIRHADEPDWPMGQDFNDQTMGVEMVAPR